MPNSEAREWYRINDSADEVEISIYGDIGDTWCGESVSAKELLDALKEADGKPVNLRINSGGGSVFDAYAMMSALRSHNGRVTAHVDGVAASAASFLIAAADEVVMSSVGWIMIHDASIWCSGTACDLRETADWMERVDDQIAGIYAARGALSKEEFAAAMDATTWYTADEALEAGLVDRVEQAVVAAACATDDAATIESAPQGAKALLGEFSPCEAVKARAAFPPSGSRDPAPAVAGDTFATIAADGADGQEAGQPEAQERVVVIDSKLYRLEN